MTCAVSTVPDLHFVGAAAGAVCLPLNASMGGQAAENITDWALNKFLAQYKSTAVKGKGARKITKEAIFHYCYAVLNDTHYREKYALNLKRELPRIPFYPDFWCWADWGAGLMEQHINFESAIPFPLTRSDVPDIKAQMAGQSPKVLLKADKSAGRIMIDSETTLTGIPPEAWAYRLGANSALEWILDQHKEKKPKDPVIRQKFNGYKFAAYKEHVIDLLMRVVTVSDYTVGIMNQMKAAQR